MQADLPFSQVLSHTTVESIKVVLARRRKESRNAPMASLILAIAPGVTDSQIQQFQEVVMPVPLLVYADTRDALVRQIAVQKAIWAAQAHGPKKLGCGL
jgi:hypothetical protein